MEHPTRRDFVVCDHNLVGKEAGDNMMPSFSQRHTRKRIDPLGLTIIEILVSVVIIAILTGIAVSGLRSTREKSRALLCMSHIRSMGNLIHSYTQDHRELFPYWLENPDRYTQSPGRWSQYTSQGFTVFENRKWLDYTGLPTNGEVMYCPSNQWYPEWYEDVSSSDYVLTPSVHINPQYLAPSLEFDQYSRTLGAQLQRLSSTRYPSSKVGLFEIVVWHGWRDHFEEDVPINGLSYWESDRPGSLWFMDEHAAQRLEKEATRPLLRYPVWPKLTYGTTPNGMHGRDFE